MVVFIEPVFNPVKFPVCSIATKVIVPMYLTLQPWLMETFTPLFGGVVTWAVVTWLLFWLPDVFGFLFWEMKENWSLYKANRAAGLQPAILGTHGETMPRLLQPGFHSGTIPKLFAKLRQAEQKALATGNFTPVRAWRAALEEVEEAVRLFVTRELLVFLEQDEGWKNQGLTVGSVRLATNQIWVELHYQKFPEQLFWLEFEERCGALTAGMTSVGWLRELPDSQQHALHQALAILYRLAGAKEVNEVAEERNLNGVLTARGLPTLDLCQ
jgi:hypothetical protein